MWPIIVEIPLPFTVLGSDVLPIRAFGLMVVVALVAANAVAMRLVRKEKMSEDFFSNLFVVFTVCAVVGARVFYVLTNLEKYRDDWTGAFRINEGGMVFYGSFLLCFAGVGWYIRKHRQPTLKVIDIYAACVGLGIGLGRIGCLLVGDDYGKPCSETFPLRIMFSTKTQDGSFLGITIPKDNHNLCGLAGQWLHPSQIYMSLNGFLMFFILHRLWHRRKFDGQVTFVFVIYYAIARSVIELFRGDRDRGFVGPLSTSQFVSAFTLLIGVAGLIWAARRARRA